MSRSTLEKNTLEALDRINPDLIDCNLNDLDNDFKYLFPTSLLLIHGINQRGTNNLSAIINRGQQRGDLPSDSMSIPNDLLAKIERQDIVNADSARATQTPFNTLFDTESMANFYAIGSNSLLARHYFAERKDSNIEDDTNQPPDNLAPGQKWEIIRHVRSRESQQILDDIVAIICQTIKEKVDIIPKP